MTDRFKMMLAQLNPVVGDIAGNVARAKAAWETGRAAGADMVALTEMFVTGYQTQDLILKPAFVAAAVAAVERLAAECAEGPALGVGGPVLQGGRLYNGYYVLEGGRVHARVLKHHLPNDAVFDEKRVFASADVHGPYVVKGVRIGTPICEDAWHPDVAETLAETGAEILLVPNGSPYHRGKPNLRLNLMVSRVVETGLPLVYLNMVGGQDDQVFDGSSMVLNPGGRLMAQLPQFDECEVMVTFRRGTEGLGGGSRRDQCRSRRSARRITAPACWPWAITCANAGSRRRVLGLSGGIDSAIVAAMAADALGPENVRCVMLPSEFTSAHSLEDASAAAGALGCGWTRCRFRARKGRWERRWRPCLPEPSRGSPRRTSSRGCAGDADGAVEQVRRDAADHRQQVRDGGGLLHDLRRHERGLQPGQGHVQDPDVPDREMAEREPSELDERPGGRGDPASGSSRSRLRPSCGRTSATMTACRPMRCWTRSWSAWSRRRWRWPRLSPWASTGRW
jgi:predicted amidohydrolase